MSGEALLLDIAKIAIAVTGFTGVLMTFRHPREAPWRANEVAGLKLLVAHSLGAVFFGLLPSLAYLRWTEEPPVWLGCSSLLAAFLAFAVLANIARLQTASGKGHPPRRMRLLLFEYFGFSIAVLYLQIHNVIVWRSGFAYAVGCLWLLFAACRQFSIFLLDVREQTDAAEPGGPKRATAGAEATPKGR